LKLAVKSLSKTYTENAGRARIVWLDAKKERAEGTRPELRPARLVHRVHETLVDLESSRPSPLEVEKILNGKLVKVGGSRVGFSLHSTWKWTAYAIARYSSEDLDMCKAYAEQD
jgi:hypothetical protein